ncbi:MAG: type II toxin-antitoxin system VapB family antitoxin [Bryobacterales bacterium]|nr:type II toxin-antitoxin system VapB family antitoxin [Bryobacterales bacterium]
MRATLIIDDNLLQRARELTGIQEKTALVRAGLEALICREVGKRLAALGGTDPKMPNIPRRRSA